MFNKTKMTDLERRQFILNGNLWRVVLWISLPLAIYNAFNHIFGMMDTIIASNIGSDSVSAIAYLNQIQIMINSIGAAISMGGSILVARVIGAGDMDKAKKYISTLFALAFTISIFLIIVLVPLAEPILRFSKTPEALIAVGRNYFIIQIFMIALIFFNNLFIATEKAKGNTKNILFLNIGVLVIKLTLTVFFVYVLHFGVTMMAVATMCSHLFMTSFAIYSTFRKKNPLRFSRKDIVIKKSFLLPLLTVAFPIFSEKFLFSFGKVVVNSMSVGYGATVVGALGISNTLGGVVTNPTNGFGDGESSIISQNVGNKNPERAIQAFYKTLTINLIIGTVGIIFMTIFMDPIISIFAKEDLVFAQQIHNIYYYERIAAVTLAITSSVNGLLFGFGYTKLSLYLSLLRLFAFRIPSLYILQHFTDLGSESVGIAMMISNGLVGIASAIMAVYIIKKVRNGNYNMNLV